MRPRIDVSIERIVLRGAAIDERQAGRFRGALELALADRLANIADVRGPLVTAPLMLSAPVDFAAQPETAAAHVADAVTGVLRGPARAVPGTGTRHG